MLVEQRNLLWVGTRESLCIILLGLTINCQIILIPIFCIISLNNLCPLSTFQELIKNYIFQLIKSWTQELLVSPPTNWRNAIMKSKTWWFKNGGSNFQIELHIVPQERLEAFWDWIKQSYRLLVANESIVSVIWVDLYRLLLFI